jgi:TPR repeat protein
MYCFGKFVQSDGSKAFALASEAASKGYSAAICYIGMYYEGGPAVRQNFSETLKYYTKAMECGSPCAIRGLAGLYKNGFGVAKDEAMADYYDQLLKERGFDRDTLKTV